VTSAPTPKTGSGRRQTGENRQRWISCSWLVGSAIAVGSFCVIFLGVIFYLFFCVSFFVFFLSFFLILLWLLSSLDICIRHSVSGLLVLVFLFGWLCFFRFALCVRGVSFESVIGILVLVVVFSLIVVSVI